jgi:ribonucleoside-diphosphate reductase alpha chain
MKKVLSDGAELVAQNRYYSEDDQGWKDCVERVVRSNMQNETNLEKEIRQRLEADFFDSIYNLKFLPAGRILRNSGRKGGSLLNCYVLPIGDSIEEIGDFYCKSLVLWSEGGGVGCNFSTLRPKDEKIKRKGGKSSGLLSFLKVSDYEAKVVESGGGRRAAGIAVIDASHPEVLNVIDSKLEHGEISSYNISIGITNEFLEKVELDDDWDLVFNQKIYATVKARNIWDKIVKNMIKCAEPGILNLTNLTKNNSYYFDPIIATNPCGEVPLSAYGVCCLGSLVLPNFITGSVNTNWKLLEDTVYLAVRFLDNVLDINRYVLKENDISAHNTRRIGLGVIGLADYLFTKQLRYGSEKALIEVERLMKFIREAAYQASIKLAMEKGAFPKFEAVPYCKASFVRKLPAQLRLDIKKYGVRNCTLLSCAPTGTISLLTGYQGGIEPLSAKGFKRCDRINERVYIHPLTIKFGDSPYPDWFVDSYDLTPQDHFETQSVVQKYLDSAVSKTINLPEHTTEEDLDKLLLEYVKDLKGVTVYRDKCRPIQIIEPLNNDEIKAALASGNYYTQMTEEEDSEDLVKCSSGTCEL